jgi:hypothetical protein
MKIKFRTTLVLGMGAAVAFAASGCDSGAGAPPATLDWVSSPSTHTEADLGVEGTFTVTTEELEVGPVGLIACVGDNVPDCGVATELVGATASATIADGGLYSGHIMLPSAANWTVVAYASVGGVPCVSAPIVVAVDPAPLTYPVGPYGTKTGSVIANLSFNGYRDSDADADSDPFNEPPIGISLDDFFTGPRGDPAAKILLITESAGWCGVCQDEAAQMAGITPTYMAKGARFMTAMFEDDQGNKPGVEYAKTWGDYFNTPHPVVVDPQNLLLPYYLENAVPLNMFVDPETMTIVEVHHGFDMAYTRSILDQYVD